jgi:hypothetical protein
MKLPRAEWDFSSVKEEHKRWAFSYEFGREIQWVRELYRNATRFDEAGNWFYVHTSGNDDESLSFCIPPGFPELPFSEAVKTARFRKYATFDFSAADELREGGRLHAHEQSLTLAINWHKPNKLILEDIQRILKRKRPFAPHRRLDARRYEGDLNSLAALRLLNSGMTAKEAAAYVKTFGRGLYKRPQEWSAAKKHALRIFQEQFATPFSLLGPK